VSHTASPAEPRHEVPPGVVVVDTAQGPARLHVSRARAARVVLAVGHGAGGGVEAADLVGLATHLPPWGVTVLRVEQPWRVAGRRVAAPPARLDEAWTTVLDHWRRQEAAGGGRSAPLVVGGRSAGARVACRTAAALAAVGVVALAFPLHPPGRPGTSRAAELERALEVVPVLVVQGERDAFGGPAELPVAAGLTVHAVAGADHSLRLGARAAAAAGLSPSELPEVLADVVRRWCLARVEG
jgi:predicted alpha/beta-hydrolase family hydrolase